MHKIPWDRSTRNTQHVHAFEMLVKRLLNLIRAVLLLACAASAVSVRERRMRCGPALRRSHWCRRSNYQGAQHALTSHPALYLRGGALIVACVVFPLTQFSYGSHFQQHGLTVFPSVLCSMLFPVTSGGLQGSASKLHQQACTCTDVQHFVRALCSIHMVQLAKLANSEASVAVALRLS
eukprot:9114-Heterococcus_DN1.PRE.2